MKASKRLILSVLVGALILALAPGSPAFAGEEALRKGVDVWMTVAGFAKTSFEEEPIPAGFFCEGSKPFTGTVEFEGAPLAAEPADSLGTVDTVVRRLDDAVFDSKGEAKTRIQLMALSLVSTKPIETSCGAYDVAVNLTGEQPTTIMNIIRKENLGGVYSAPLALNVKVAFTPVSGDKKDRLELTRGVDLGPAKGSVWIYASAPRYEGVVRIDTNGDGRPDTQLPAASNFLPGVAPSVFKGQPAPALKAQTAGPGVPISCPAGQCPYRSCHCTGLDDNPGYDEPGSACESSHLHCIWTCAPAGYPGSLCAVAHPVGPE